MNRQTTFRPVLLLASVTALSAAAVLAPPTRVQAACAARDPGATIASAPLVLVGTVTGTTNASRTATVHVEEIWRGGNLPSEVTMHGSPGEVAATDVDRTYDVGSRYIFVPTGTTSPFDDNACSATTTLTPDAARLRPASARTVAPPATVGLTPSMWVAVDIGLLSVVVVLGLTGYRFRTRRPA